ncbi:hypothetical protein Tco_0868018 [Tanacetum coccineum]
MTYISPWRNTEEEKAQRHGLTFNWQTATFRKVRNYEDEDDCFADFETKFPAIVFDNLITSDTALPYEPMVSSTNKNKIDFRISLDETDDEDYTIIFDKNSFSYKIIYVNDLKTDSESDKILMPSSSEPTVNYLDDLDYFNDFDNEFPAIFYNDGLTSKPELEIKPPIWHLYLLQIRDTLGSDTRLRDLMRVFRDIEDGIHWGRWSEGIYESWLEEIVWDPSTFGGVRRRLHTKQEMAEAGFRAYWVGSDRVIPDKGDLKDYWIEISSDRYFLGPAPSYVLIRDPVRRLCHKMIAYSISGRGQAPEKVIGVGLFYLRNMDQGTANVLHLLVQYLFRHTEGRKSRARLLGGYFIGHLATHFGLVNDEGLRGLQVAMAGDHEADEACPTVDEGAQDVLAPAQVPSPPPPALQPRTMPQRIKRIEEETRNLRHDVVGLREVVESFTTEQSRVSTWLISYMTQLMDAIGHTYQAFDGTLIGSSRMPYQRHVRPKTGDANTSAVPHTDDQPDP